MPVFAQRSQVPEVMEQLADFNKYRTCMKDLAQVNLLTLSYPPTMTFIARLGAKDKAITVLDVGSGYGDFLRRIARLGRRKGWSMKLMGADLHPFSIRAAREASTDEPDIRWIEGDAYTIGEPIDVVISSLLTHHLDDDGVVKFLSWMEARSQRGWFINDLHRHPIPYWGFWLLARLMAWHRIVREDGLISITRGFTKRDWQEFLRRAGITEARIRWRFPFRYCVERIK